MCFAYSRVQPLHKPLTRFGAGSLSWTVANQHFQRIFGILTIRLDIQRWPAMWKYGEIRDPHGFQELCERP